MQNSRENINDYFQYTVITKIEYVNENPMTLPAFTLCLVSLKANLVNATLGESLYNCLFLNHKAIIKIYENHFNFNFNKSLIVRLAPYRYFVY